MNSPSEVPASFSARDGARRTMHRRVEEEGRKRLKKDVKETAETKEEKVELKCKRILIRRRGKIMIRGRGGINDKEEETALDNVEKRQSQNTNE